MRQQDRVAYIVTEIPGRKPQWTRAGRGYIDEDGEEVIYLTVLPANGQKVVIRDWREVPTDTQTS